MEDYWSRDLAENVTDASSFTNSRDFKLESSANRHLLQDHLRNGKVYCSKKLRSDIAETPYMTLQGHPTWPENDCPTGHAKLNKVNTAKLYTQKLNNQHSPNFRELSDNLAATTLVRLAPKTMQRFLLKGWSQRQKCTKCNHLMCTCTLMRLALTLNSISSCTMISGSNPHSVMKIF